MVLIKYGVPHIHGSCHIIEVISQAKIRCDDDDNDDDDDKVSKMVASVMYCFPYHKHYSKDIIYIYFYCYTHPVEGC